MKQTYFSDGRVHDQSPPNLDTEALLDGALRPLAQSIGLNDEAIARAVDRDFSRRTAKAAFDLLESEGIYADSKQILDLGAGLGQTSVEAIARGGEPVALEPGFAWCQIVSHRLAGFDKGMAVCADGEKLPFQDEKFDIIMSVAVLEHVRNPKRYLAEAYRVLKPGGFLYLSCENYLSLSFWEPHYQLPWLPLFPKPLASLYLTLCGRSSAFLWSSITYTTRPSVVRNLRKLGFQFKGETDRRLALENSASIANPLKKLVVKAFARLFSSATSARILFELEHWRMAFTAAQVVIVAQKPSLLQRQ